MVFSSCARTVEDTPSKPRPHPLSVCLFLSLSFKPAYICTITPSFLLMVRELYEWTQVASAIDGVLPRPARGALSIARVERERDLESIPTSRRERAKRQQNFGPPERKLPSCPSSRYLHMSSLNQLFLFRNSHTQDQLQVYVRIRSQKETTRVKPGHLPSAWSRSYKAWLRLP